MRRWKKICKSMSLIIYLYNRFYKIPTMLRQIFNGTWQSFRVHNMLVVAHELYAITLSCHHWPTSFHSQMTFMSMEKKKSKNWIFLLLVDTCSYLTNKFCYLIVYFCYTPSTNHIGWIKCRITKNWRSNWTRWKWVKRWPLENSLTFNILYEPTNTKK